MGSEPVGIVAADAMRALLLRGSVPQIPSGLSLLTAAATTAVGVIQPALTDGRRGGGPAAGGSIGDARQILRRTAASALWAPDPRARPAFFFWR